MAPPRSLQLLLVLGSATLGQALHLQSSSEKERPVMKVVRLLQDMQAELEKDLEDDKSVHEKLDCWCKTNDKEKTQAIAEGEGKEEALKSELGEAAAKMEELKEKRDATLAEVNRDEEALQKASTLRMEEKKVFHSEDLNLMEAIKACDQAITVLGKHHASLAQVQTVADSLQKVQILSLAQKASIQPAEMLALRSFLLQAKQEAKNEPATSFLQIPGYKSYAPQSGQIFGVLQQLKEDFEKDQSEAATREQKAIEDFDSLKAAKQDEISTGRKLQADLDEQVADLKVKHAEAFQELEDTQAQLDLDRTFLSNLKEKCSADGAEFDQRVKDRLEEISAVADTIKIINEDESFYAFDKSVNSFLQIDESASTKERLQRASQVLLQAAAATSAPELALLASRAQLDAFTKVKEEIEKMITLLLKQQQDEIEHRDWCIEELAENERSISESDDQKEALQTKIADLNKSIETLSSDIDATTAAVAEMQKQMSRASDNREAENAEFQQTVSDQRLAQMILAKALNRMKDVYAMLQEEPEVGAAHIETSGNHTDAGNGPARFTKYDKHSGGSKVVSMIEKVIADSKTTEDEAVSSEHEGQSVYEGFMKDSNKAITAYSKKLMNLKGSRAKAAEELTMAKDDLKATVLTLEELYSTKGNTHKSCDFITSTFDERQGARTAEVEALKTAKAILSGAK